MPVINKKDKWVYFFNPRTASRATADWLVDHVIGAERVSGNHHNGLDFLIKKGHVPEDHEDWDFYQTVRHPCDWVTSVFLATNAYRGKYPRLINWFKDGMPGIPNGPDHTFFWRFPGVSALLYEDIEWSLQNAFGPLKPLYYNEAHKTEGKGDWHDHWQMREVEFARKHFIDLEKWGYEL
jgi:hypothetical protein